MRYVLRPKPLVTASVDKLVTAIVPIIERYLTSDPRLTPRGLPASMPTHRR